MQNGFYSEHWNDENENPAGGISCGRGFTIGWQHGPLGRGDSRKEPNGAFVEDVIGAALDRLNYYQDSKFACKENEDAIDSLNNAMDALERRTRGRESRSVEGTHQA